MTDKTRQDSGNTHIIRYALELGLLWIDGDGRDKVREALEALDILEAKLESVGAGGVQALSAAPAIKPLVWSDESGPTDKIRYNHITAETALGQVSVEWIGQKEEDVQCVYLAGDYIGVASNLDGAKQLAERHIRDLVANLLAASPPAEQQEKHTCTCPSGDGSLRWPCPQHPVEQAAPEAAPGEPFQHRVQPWLLQCFGAEIAADTVERNHRFLEEALELVQSTGCTQSEAHQLVDYVFGRPVGEPAQEVGGVMVTLAALCLANGLDMHNAGEIELARIWTKVEAIRAKQAAKPKHSPLPQAAPQQEAQERVYLVNTGEVRNGLEMYERHEKPVPLADFEVLYTAQPAPAPLSEMPYEKRKAIQEGEQISASDAWFHARLNMLDTLDRRNVFRAGFDRGWNAALAAQGGK